MTEICEEKRRLIEEIGVMLRGRTELSPLATRIYASLILSSIQGLTFNGIIRTTQASKSATSNNLNVLLKLGFVEYYTKPGDRKRYFRTSQSYARKAMEQHKNLYEKELEIVDKITNYNKEHNPDKFKNEKSLDNLFQDYLLEQRQRITFRIKEIKIAQG